MFMHVKYLFPNIPELVSNPADSGYDIRAAIEEPLKIAGYGKACIPTGIAVELTGIPYYENGYEWRKEPCAEYMTAELQVRPRSGHTKHGIVAQFGTIDASYRGEISVNIFNQNANEVEIQPLERIAQLVVCPVMKPRVIKVDRLSNTERGSNGFGSTGKD